MGGGSCPLGAAALPRLPALLDRAELWPMASVNGSELHDWLLEAAGVHTRFVGKVLGVLEAEEVMSLDDLQLLAASPAFGSCGISTLNILKIRGGYGRMTLSRTLCLALRGAREAEGEKTVLAWSYCASCDRPDCIRLASCVASDLRAWSLVA